MLRQSVKCSLRVLRRTPLHPPCDTEGSRITAPPAQAHSHTRSSPLSCVDETQSRSSPSHAAPAAAGTTTTSATFIDPQPSHQTQKKKSTTSGSGSADLHTAHRLTAALLLARNRHRERSAHTASSTTTGPPPPPPHYPIHREAKTMARSAAGVSPVGSSDSSLVGGGLKKEPTTSSSHRNTQTTSTARFIAPVAVPTSSSSSSSMSQPPQSQQRGEKAAEQRPTIPPTLGVTKKTNAELVAILNAMGRSAYVLHICRQRHLLRMESGVTAETVTEGNKTFIRAWKQGRRRGSNPLSSQSPPLTRAVSGSSRGDRAPPDTTSNWTTTEKEAEPASRTPQQQQQQQPQPSGYLSRVLPWVERAQWRWDRLPGHRKLWWALSSPQGHRWSRLLFRAPARFVLNALSSAGEGQRRRRRQRRMKSCGTRVPRRDGGRRAHASSSSSPSGVAEEASWREPYASVQVRAQVPAIVSSAAASGHVMVNPCEVGMAPALSGVRVLLGEKVNLPLQARRQTPGGAASESEGGSQHRIARPSFLPLSIPALPPTTLRMMHGVGAGRQRQRRAAWKRAVRRLCRGGTGSDSAEAASTFMKDLKMLQRHVRQAPSPDAEQVEASQEEEEMEEVSGAISAEMKPGEATARTPSPAGVRMISGTAAPHAAGRRAEEKAERERTEEADFMDYCSALGVVNPRSAFVLERLWGHLEEVERSPTDQMKRLRPLVQEFSHQYDEWLNQASNPLPAVAAAAPSSSGPSTTTWTRDSPARRSGNGPYASSSSCTVGKEQEKGEERGNQRLLEEESHRSPVEVAGHLLQEDTRHRLHQFQQQLPALKQLLHDIMYDSPEMYTPEESVDDIKTSLSHIEGLIQRGTELLYGDEQAVGSAAAPGPQAAAAAGAKKTATAKSAVSRPAARGGAKAAAAAAAARTSASPASRQRSSSKPDLAVADMTMKPSTVNPLPPRGRAESKGREGSFFDEELRYEEIDKFFQEDARRIAKLERESRRLRRAEARKKAMSPTDSPAPTHHHTAARRGAEPEEEEEPPEKVNLEEVRARIHKEVEAYRAMCQKGENPNEASTWSSHKLTPRKDARYVSPYASQQRTKNIWAKPAPMKQPPRRAPSHKAQPASVPIPPRKPRAPIDRSVPIWERLYSDSKQAQSSPSVTGEDDDDNSTTPLYSHIPPSKKLSRTNSTPVQPLHKPAAPQSKLKRSSSAVPKHSSSMLNKPNRDLSPEAAIPPRGRHAGRMERSDSPMNAPVLRHVTTNNHSSVGGGAPPPRGGLMDIELDDENAPTMPFISPLDLRNL